MYTIKEVADFSKISTRTLRYYDQIGLLKPTDHNDAGYRLYDNEAVDLLQQILFYKHLGLGLQDIQDIVQSNDFNRKRALKEHHEALKLEMKRIGTLIHTIENTLLYMEGELNMSNKDKFEGFKTSLIKDHEEKYGQEARKLYGDAVDVANKKIMEMTEMEYENLEAMTDKMHALFKEACQSGDIESEVATEACQLHVKWIQHYWTEYSKAAHIGLVEMYVSDERFKAYYDKIHDGLAVFIRDAVKKHLE